MSWKKVAKAVIFLAMLVVAAATAVYFLQLASGDDISIVRDPNKKYNLILIVADALRHDVLGCYGGEAETPHLDRLAQSGVIFENAYSTSSWTPPASVSMFTSNYATSYGYGRVLENNSSLCAC
jgi:glucan phosphoethanolaminetransferase (alkaline phosphatase superfamily)